jgi:hypothetical protein
MAFIQSHQYVWCDILLMEDRVVSYAKNDGTTMLWHSLISLSYMKTHDDFMREFMARSPSS